MSWYRTYRPQRFSDLHIASVKEAYQRLLSSGSFSHAYLLTGPKGTGKTSGARILAKMLNCTANKKAVADFVSTGEKKKKIELLEPCNACSSCIAITNGNSMSVLEMDAASNRGIDDIRQLRERIGLAPPDGQVAVYIIDEVHMLTTEAFNALLKVLEEPPRHVVFILATTDAQKMPGTVVSRCTQIHYRKANNEEIALALSGIAKTEGIAIEDGVLLRVAQLSEGSFRDAVKLLESIGIGRTQIGFADVDSIVGTSSTTLVSVLLNALVAKDAVQISAVFSALQEQGMDGGVFHADVIKTLHGRLLEYAKVGDKRLSVVVCLFKQIAVPLDSSLPIPWIGFELACLEWTLGSSEASAPQAVSSPQQTVTKQKTTLKSVSSSPSVSASVAETVAATPIQPVSSISSLPPIEPPTGISSIAVVEFSTIESKWIAILQNVKIKSTSVEGLLRATKPKEIRENKLIIEALYQFHKEQLEQDRNRHVIETVLESVCGSPLQVEFEVGIKTTVINSPHNNVSGSVADEALVKAATEAFS